MKKESLNERVREMRGRYLEKEISHDEYYLWLADQIGVTFALVPFPKETIKAELKKDRCLNGTPLRAWDAKHPVVAYYAAGLVWSLSDTVCVLKAVARREAEG
jgi:hypothetical protein